MNTTTRIMQTGDYIRCEGFVTQGNFFAISVLFKNISLGSKTAPNPIRDFIEFPGPQPGMAVFMLVGVIYNGINRCRF
jgi:hypothetical protein